MNGPIRSQFRRTAGWSLLVLVAAAPQRDCLAEEYREQVMVRAPTRLDWRFAVAKQRRAELPSESVGPDYDSGSQSYELFVPEHKAPRGSPLVLFISHTDQASGWRFWSKACKANRVIFAGPHGAGEKSKAAHRIRLVLDVLDDVRQRQFVDPDRTYLCGFSDGAHIACQIAFSLPEYFGGVIAIGGGEPPPSELWLRHQVADRLSIAIVKSRRESDRRECFFSDVFSTLAEEAGARTELFPYSRSPRQLPAEPMLAGLIRWLDAGVEHRRGLALQFPSTRVGHHDVAPPEELAQRVLADANKGLLGDEETFYAACMRLKGLCQRWPKLSVATQAQRILDDHEPRWRDRWLAEREAVFLQYERAHGHVYSVVFQHYLPGRLIKGTSSEYPEEHAQLHWDEPHQEAANGNARSYDAATQMHLKRLGLRVRFDPRGRVNVLDLTGTLVTIGQFRDLKKQLDGMQSLRALNLSSTVLRGAVLGQLSELTGLRAIDLSHTDITDRSLASLSGLDKMQSLFVVGTDLSSLRQLGTPRNLQTLIAGKTKLDDRALGWLADATELRKLSLFSTDVSDRGVAGLAALPRLEYLNLGSTRVTGSIGSTLGQFAALRELVLDGTELSDPGLSTLSGLKLRYLSLSGNDITDAGLRQFRPGPTLQRIDLGKTKVSARGIADLQAALPDLQIVWDGSADDPISETRRRLRTEMYLRSVEDIYRRKLAEYQNRYFGFSMPYEL